MTQNRIKKYGKMEFKKETPDEIEEQSVIIISDKLRSELDSIKFRVSEINEESNNKKQLKEISKNLTEITDELIPVMKKMVDLKKGGKNKEIDFVVDLIVPIIKKISDLRKKMNQ